MTRARRRALLAITLAGLALAFMVAKRGPKPLPPRPENNRPTLLLLTSLPLLFGEDFSIQQTGSAALKALNMRYRVVPISVSDPPELSKGRLLLMAHPRAQPAEDLVALDQWVRGGGRVLLLADPVLEWPSDRPLGDRLRPPPAFADTGLLAHWGLRLDGPSQYGATTARLGGFDVVTVSRGNLAGRCRISADLLVANCRIGRGRVTVIADADLLDSGRLGAEAAHNLDGILAELSRLEAG